MNLVASGGVAPRPDELEHVWQEARELLGREDLDGKAIGETAVDLCGDDAEPVKDGRGGGDAPVDLCDDDDDDDEEDVVEVVPASKKARKGGGADVICID
jgi:hypothetical protein